MGKICRGKNGDLVIQQDKIILEKSMLKGFLRGGLVTRGDKTIPFSSINAIQFKSAGIRQGFITFSVGEEALNTHNPFPRKAIVENTITFKRKSNAEFKGARRIIEERILQKHC